MGLGISEAVDLAKQVAELVKQGITIDLQERVMDLREAVLNAKDEVLALREENRHLRDRLHEQQSWRERAAKYQLVTAPGGALVYCTEGPPPHYACPSCFERGETFPLQDRGLSNGVSECPSCKQGFNVNIRQPITAPDVRLDLP